MHGGRINKWQHCVISFPWVFFLFPFFYFQILLLENIAESFGENKHKRNTWQQQRTSERLPIQICASNAIGVHQGDIGRRGPASLLLRRCSSDAEPSTIHEVIL